MKNKNQEILKREVTHIELIWEDQEDLLNLASSDQFKTFILEESLKAIVDSLENKLEKAELFNILNMAAIIEIKKSQFKPVLNKVLELFLSNEEYERCSELKKLIKKYKL